MGFAPRGEVDEEGKVCPELAVVETGPGFMSPSQDYTINICICLECYIINN